jgi:Tol biopolymer transport system component
MLKQLATRGRRLAFSSKMTMKLTVLLFMIVTMPVMAQVDGTAGQLIDVCPGVGIQQRTPDFQPGGIILTTFDKTNIWVYNIDSDRRYPLPDTHPCGTNCRLSSDALWVTYMNAENSTYGKMRLDGTERSLLVNYAADVEWWSEDTLLVWTPGRLAYLQAIGSDEREYLNVDGVYSVQPGGKWGVMLEQNGDDFTRSLINLDLRDLPGIAEQRRLLDIYTPYFNAESWSPDGQWLAYVSQAAVDPALNVAGGEIFGVQPGDTAPIQWTDLTGLYGAVRINGLTSRELSWSPDGTRIAFWVIKLTGADPAGTTAEAKIHILDINTGELRAYCGFTTTEHTPNPPRLIWSPDGTHLAFGGNVPADDKGYLLLALDTTTGIFTELSNGIFPALGNADVIVWGLPPR